MRLDSAKEERVKERGQGRLSTKIPHSFPGSYHPYWKTDVSNSGANGIFGKSDIHEFYFPQIEFSLIDFFFSNGQVPV